MKKFLIKSCLVALFAATLVSCEEDRIIYSGGDFVTFENGGEERLSVFENAGTVTVPVHLSVPRTEDVTVNLSTTNGEAVSGADFNLLTTTVTIPAGETEAVASFSIVDNTDFGEAKTFVLSISGTSAPDIVLGLSGDIGTYQKTVSIVNDDCPSKYTIWVGDLDVEDVGYGITPGTGAVTPDGTCDILRVDNNLGGVPSMIAGTTFDLLFTPDFDGATTGTVEVKPTYTRMSGANFVTYSALGVYDEDTMTITLDYSVDARSGSANGPVLGNFWTGTNVIMPAQ